MQRTMRQPPPRPVIDRPVRPTLGGFAVPVGRAALAPLLLQRTAGNRAVAALLRNEIVVSRCGPDHPECSCADVESTTSVQRDGPPWALPKDATQADKLTFTDRFFVDESLPTMCPLCHRTRPTVPAPAPLLDRDATEARLVAWAQDSAARLHVGGVVRVLQLAPNAYDAVVDDYGLGLTQNIASSQTFAGSPAARERGVETIRRHWAEIRPVVRTNLQAWYQAELIKAAGLTLRDASPVLAPAHLQAVLGTHVGRTLRLGRHNFTASTGDRYGPFVIDDITDSSVLFHLPDRPLWLYEISTTAFLRTDPLVTETFRQVYDNTKWILQLMPFLLKAGAFALGFSGSVALIITSILVDELAEEMKADADGRPGRSPGEILGDAGVQLLVDRIFHGLLGGGAGRAVESAGKVAGKIVAKIDRIAERAAPMIRRELVEAEKPLVKEALEKATARKVSDKALTAEGYAVEVSIVSGGEPHVFRLGKDGKWCRFSSTVCGLDLGTEVAAAAKSPASFTRASLDDTRAMLATVSAEIELLGSAYERVRKAGRMDLSLLSAEERAVLDHYAPTGHAGEVTLVQLRDLPATLGLKQDFAKGVAAENKLIAQLRLDTRPLYEKMRIASPSAAAKSATRREYGSSLDFATMRAPRSGALEIDHVVPLSEIVRMPGFDKLPFERQLELVNDVKNLRPIDSLANSSRGERSFHFWPQAALHYDAKALATLRKLEDEMRDYLQKRIAALARR